MDLKRYDNITNRRKFFRNYAKFSEWFGAENVDAALTLVNFDKLVEVYKTEQKHNARCYHTVNLELPAGLDFIHKTHPMDSSYSKTIHVMCNRWLVPNQYQRLVDESILRLNLLKKYPWLRRYTLEIYGLDFYPNSGSPEFYVNIGKSVNGHRSLYVPYEAFFAGDVEAIIKRNQTYLNWYTKGDDVWNAISAQPSVQKFLDSVRKRNPKIQ